MADLISRWLKIEPSAPLTHRAAPPRYDTPDTIGEWSLRADAWPLGVDRDSDGAGLGDAGRAEEALCGLIYPCGARVRTRRGEPEFSVTQQTDQTGAHVFTYAVVYGGREVKVDQLADAGVGRDGRVRPMPAEVAPMPETLSSHGLSSVASSGGGGGSSSRSDHDGEGERKAEVEREVSAESLLDGAGVGSGFYLPECIAVQSGWPFVRLGKELVSIAYTLREDDSALEAFCQVVKACLPSACPPGTVLQLRGGAESAPDSLPPAAVDALKLLHVDMYTPSLLDLPLLGFPAQPLLYALDVQCVLTVLGALLEERQVLLVARSPVMLANASSMLVSLLYPFPYVYTCIPFLPAHMLDYLGSPTPFLMGIKTDSLDYVKDNDILSPGVVTVMLDLGKLEVDGDPVEPIPVDMLDMERLLEASRLTLCKDMRFMDTIEPKYKFLRAQRDNESVRYVGGKHVFAESHDNPSEVPVRDDDAQLFRTAMLRVFVNIMTCTDGTTYRDFMPDVDQHVLIDAGGPEGRVAFDSRGFVAASTDARKSFVEHLCRSQAFSMFVQERLASSFAYNDAFDEAVRSISHLSWLNRTFRRAIPWGCAVVDVLTHPRTPLTETSGDLTVDSEATIPDPPMLVKAASEVRGSPSELARSVMMSLKKTVSQGNSDSSGGIRTFVGLSQLTTGRIASFGISSLLEDAHGKAEPVLRRADSDNAEEALSVGDAFVITTTSAVVAAGSPAPEVLLLRAMTMQGIGAFQSALKDYNEAMGALADRGHPVTASLFHAVVVAIAGWLCRDAVQLYCSDARGSDDPAVIAAQFRDLVSRITSSIQGLGQRAKLRTDIETDAARALAAFVRIQAAEFGPHVAEIAKLVFPNIPDRIPDPIATPASADGIPVVGAALGESRHSLESAGQASTSTSCAVPMPSRRTSADNHMAELLHGMVVDVRDLLKFDIVARMQQANAVSWAQVDKWLDSWLLIESVTSVLNCRLLPSEMATIHKLVHTPSSVRLCDVRNAPAVDLHKQRIEHTNSALQASQQLLDVFLSIGFGDGAVACTRRSISTSEDGAERKREETPLSPVVSEASSPRSSVASGAAHSVDAESARTLSSQDKHAAKEMVLERTISRIAEAMRHPDHGVPLVESRFLMRNTPPVFTGAAAIEWMLENKFVEDKSMAIAYGRRMQDAGVIAFASRAALSTKFGDSTTKFRFTFREQPGKDKPLADVVNQVNIAEIRGNVALCDAALATGVLRSIRAHIFPAGATQVAFWLNGVCSPALLLESAKHSGSIYDCCIADRLTVLPVDVSAHNLLCLHARISLPASRGKISSSQFVRSSYNIGGQEYSILQIRRYIMGIGRRVCCKFLWLDSARTSRPMGSLLELDERLHFALFDSMWLSPKLRIFAAEHLDSQLNRAAEQFVQDTVTWDASKSELMLPCRPFRQHLNDFGGKPDRLAATVVRYMDGPPGDSLRLHVQEKKKLTLRFYGSRDVHTLEPLSMRLLDSSVLSR